MSSFVYYLIPSVFLLITIRKLCESKWGKCKNTVQLNGKVAIVTGANSGIGYEITKELVKRNCFVILACRNLNLAKNAIENINNDLLSVDNLMIAMELDLSSLKSVKRFAEIIHKQYRNIDLLINNAGIAYPKTTPKLTKDGIEVHFGVNHLGHFYLTNLLMDQLKQQSRIVIISSKLAETAPNDINAIVGNTVCDTTVGNTVSAKLNLYANSKLANLYFARELAKKHKNTDMQIYSIFPGWVYTNLFRHSIKWYYYILALPVAFLFMRTPKQGAQTAIYCATEPSLETGVIYRNCRKYGSKIQFNDEIGRELWQKSENLIENSMKQLQTSATYRRNL